MAIMMDSWGAEDDLHACEDELAEAEWELSELSELKELKERLKAFIADLRKDSKTNMVISHAIAADLEMTVLYG